MFRKMLYRYIAVSENIYIQCRSFKGRTFSRTPLKVLTKSEADSSRKPRPIAATKSRVESNLRTTDDDRTYEKLQHTDEGFIKMMMSVKMKKFREANSKIMLEGHRLIKEAVECGVSAECIFFSSEDKLESIPLNKLSNNVQLFKASYKQMQAWSDLTTCPGIMGIFKKPNYDEFLHERDGNFPVSIICDNLREPGNMGSVLRCAAAVGCSKVYVAKGCVDVWDTKVLRTGCGAHFHIPIVDVNFEDMENYFTPETAVYLADNNFSVVPHRDENIPLHMYSDVSYGSCDSVVIVGGETEGLSAEAHELAKSRFGVRTFIPMENNMESLNSAMALSIILFEMKRQWQASTENSKSTIKE